jgi:hypothetical protein
MEPFFTLRSFTNELRMFEDHLEGEFFGVDIVAAFGKKFYSLKYSEIESVEISDTHDGLVKILEINFAGKPEFEKKHLQASNLFFRNTRRADIENCMMVKRLIEHLMENLYQFEAVEKILNPGKEGLNPGKKIKENGLDLRKNAFSLFGLF